MSGSRADVAGVFAAISNSDRLAIIEALRERAGHDAAMTVTEIAAATELSRFSASRHLQILRQAGLIDVSRRGTALMHTLRREGFEAIEDWLYPYVDQIWGTDSVAPAIPGRAA